MLSSLVALNEVRALFPGGFLTLSWVPFAGMSLGLNAVSAFLPKKTFIKLDNLMYSAYLRTCLFVFENISAVQINFYGDYEALKSKRETAIILSNHQSDTDWAAVVMLATRQLNGEHMLRVMVKDVIRFVPLFGWYIYQHGFIYVRRFKNFVLPPVIRQLKYLAGLGEPFWLLIFPEGTRFSPKKQSVIKSSQDYCRINGYSPFNSVLFPRVNGFALALNELRGCLDAVYDVTIAYGQASDPSRLRKAPNMLEFVCAPGRRRAIHFHIRRFSISEIPKDKEGIKSWLADRYSAKNAMLEQFYSGGDLPDLVEKSAQLSPLCKTVPSAGFYAASLIATLFSSVAWKFFVTTVVSSPFLIFWLRLRNAY